MKTMQSDRDYAYGATMLTLRTKIGLTQAELANQLGITRLAVGKWEAGSTYPKPEHLKALIELAVKSQAFPKGAEAEEIHALWKITHQKILLDERWFSTLLQEPDLAPPSVPEITNHTPATTLPASETKGKSDDAPSVPFLHEHEDAHAPKTTRPHKRLLGILIVLVILTIIGSTGIFFFHTIEGRAPKNAYPSYLTGNGTLAFFDPLSQQDGRRWEVVSPTGSEKSCLFTGGAYHASRQSADYLASCSTFGTFSNFAFEVQLTIMQGDCGGMIFRDDGNWHYYIFNICESGASWVSKYLSSSYEKLRVVSYNSAIYSGFGKPNKIAVVAAGSSMTFYVNEQQIIQVQDSSYTSGSIELIANPAYGDVTDAAYSNARLWTL